MTTYTAPVQDMMFVLDELADLESVATLPGYEEATPDVVQAVLEEAAKLAEGVLAPLNQIGDQQGSRMEGGEVKTPVGWKEAYRTFIEAGWNGLAVEEKYGGQNLPWLLATAVQEMWHASNMAFGLCPMLTQGAVEALLLHGSPALQDVYLSRLVSGEWTGTMNLTEPQAGSDLSAVRMKAVPEGDHYRLFGQKIFITYGDHDLTENIVHMVLARLPDAPEGVKGISLFLAPKMLPDAAGNVGQRNDVRCVSLEHKLGIHASPTCVLAFGDKDGAVAYLVGEENRGLEYMFTMMNLARHAVGVEGLAIAERALQQARGYAKERIQGRPLGAPSAERFPIAYHPDVRRMLMTMRAKVEAMRALAYLWASSYDKALRHPEEDERRRCFQMVELLTPVVKGWCAETGNEVTSLGIQIHGGMGYIEETGAAQYFRDARITTIYEGTTGIQANDLVGRKILRDQGQAARSFLDTLRDIDLDVLDGAGRAVESGIAHLEQATDWIVSAAGRDPRLPAAASGYYLQMWGVVVGGWLMAKAALVAQCKLHSGGGDADFYRAKIETAHFFATHALPQTAALLRIITDGSEASLALEPELL